MSFKTWGAEVKSSQKYIYLKILLKYSKYLYFVTSQFWWRVCEVCRWAAARLRLHGASFNPWASARPLHSFLSRLRPESSAVHQRVNLMFEVSAAAHMLSLLEQIQVSALPSRIHCTFGLRLHWKRGWQMTPVNRWLWGPHMEHQRLGEISGSVISEVFITRHLLQSLLIVTGLEDVISRQVLDRNGLYEPVLFLNSTPAPKQREHHPEDKPAHYNSLTF